MIENWKYSQPEALNRILQGKKVVHKDYTQTGSVASGSWEAKGVVAPDGKIWFLRTIQILIPSDADATTGSHRVMLQVRPNMVTVLEGKSTYDADLVFSNGFWQNANTWNRPPDSATPQQCVSSVLIGSTDGIRFAYYNGTDVVQENDREYYLDALEVTVS